MSGILIVDDSVMNRAAIAEALDDYEVIEAMDVDDGIARVQEIGDVFTTVIYSADQMEDGGKRFVEELRAQSNSSSIDAIALISDNSKLSVEDAIQAGADIAFGRPFDMAKLRDRVLEALA